MLKRILSISVWILTALALVALLGFARYTHYNKPIKGLDLSIEGQKVGGFLNHTTMSQDIKDLLAIDLRSPLKTVHITALQTDLLKNPYITKAEASTTIEGIVKVKLYERKPLVRIFTKTDQSMYIDAQGNIFPTHPDYTPHLLVANGYIETIRNNSSRIANVGDPAFTNSHLQSIVQIATEIKNNTFLNALIDQIYIDSLNEIELTPMIGDATIVLGDGENLSEKLDNIAIFYKAKATSAELSAYTTISAKYSNQIVCIKRDTL